jgi:hypothetical protein
MDGDKMSNLYKGPSIDASYQVSVHLAEGFQRRRLKCEKLMDDRRRTPKVHLAKILNIILVSELGQFFLNLL